VLTCATGCRPDGKLKLSIKAKWQHDALVDPDAMTEATELTELSMTTAKSRKSKHKHDKHHGDDEQVSQCPALLPCWGAMPLAPDKWKVMGVVGTLVIVASLCLWCRISVVLTTQARELLMMPSKMRRAGL
jgi:hypothetical protein